MLLIAVDQFRYDYLERFGDLFVANGLRRLLRDGASWTQSNYDHMPTYTAPGHGTMMTGAYPAEIGHHRQRVAGPRHRQTSYERF